MADKSLNFRTIQLHDTQANWDNFSSFIPRRGELVIYDVDETHEVERFKIGDGVSSIAELPFNVEKSIRDFLNSRTEIFYIDGGRISDQ